MTQSMGMVRAVGASICLLASIALFIPSPRSDISEVASFTLLNVVQILLFLASRLLISPLEPGRLVLIGLETLTFGAIVWVYVKALALY